MYEPDFQDLSDLEERTPTSSDDDEYNNDYDDDDDDEIGRFLPITENGFITEVRNMLTREEVQQLISEDANNNTKADYKALNEKISQLLNDEASSDTILQANDGTFFVHQLILCMWSDTFQTLESDKSWTPSKDCQKHVLSLKERPEDTTIFRDFLKFMYNGSVTIDFDQIWKLVSLADKYKVKDLKNACSRVLLCHISNSPIDEQLVKLLAPAETWTMWDLHEAIMLRILQNIYFFSDRLLPALSIDQLCQILERSDLVAEDEFKLLQKLMPRLEKLQNDHDHTSVTKILNLVRFTEMSGTQLNEVKQYELMKPLKLKLNEASFHRCLLWEGQESNVDRRGSRLYLNPPSPYVHINGGKISTLSMFFPPNCDGGWKYSIQLTIEPNSQTERPEFMPPYDYFYDCKRLYFILTKKTSLQCISYGVHIKHSHFNLQHDKLFVRVEISNNEARTRFLVDRKANVIIIVHDESKNCTYPVLSTKVSVKIDFNNNAIKFTQPIEFSSSLVMPILEEIYLSLFIYIPFD